MKGFLITLLLLASWATAQGTPSPADFFRHKASDIPFETWSYQFLLDNGTVAYLNYAWVDLPAVGPKLTAELSFYQFQGKNLQVGKQFPTHDWKESQQPASISIRKTYSMEGLPGKGHRVRFATSKNEGYALDLQFLSAQPGLRAPAQKLQGTSISTVVHIPAGRVRGTLVVGKDSLNVEGNGCLVHTWFPRKLTDFAQRSLQFCSPSSPYLSGMLFQGKQGSAAGIALRQRNGELQLLQPQRIESQGKSIHIAWLDTQEPSWTIDLQKPFQKYSALATVDSWMEKQAAKIALGGERILWRGKSTLEGAPLYWIASGFDQ